MSVTMTPFFLLVAGLLLYYLAPNPKAQEIGRAGIWIGLFWSVSAVSTLVL